MKQIIFCDIENKVEHGGILLDDGDVVCGCCGGLIPQDEIENACDEEGKEILSELGITYDCGKEMTTYRILKVFPKWEDLDDFIKIL